MTSRRWAFLIALLVAVLGAFVFVLRETEREIRSELPAAASPVNGPIASRAFDPHSQSAQAASNTVWMAVSNAQSSKLANGLQLVIIPDPSAAEVTNMVWYKAGSADDPVGRSGLAHFVEHLTFAESRGQAARQFSELLEKLGEKQDAVTTFDFTVYYQLVSPEDLRDVLALEAHRMGKLRLDSVPMAAERKEVLEERREGQANPESALDEQMRAVFYKGHPYGVPVLGLPRDFKKISSQDALNFYRQRYGPGNAIVVLHGRGDPDQMKLLAEEYFRNIPVRPIAQRGVPQPFLPTAVSPVIVEEKRATDSVWKRDYLAPSYSAGATEHAYALQILAEMLGGGPESRLHKLLVEEKKLATFVSVHYDAEALDLSPFSIFVATAAGLDVQELEKGIELAWQALLSDVASATELVHAKQDLKTKAAFQEEKMPMAAKIVGEALTRNRTLQETKDWPRRIDAVTEHQVRAAARMLAAAPYVSGMLVPKNK